jgi:hypothetical protein
MGVFPNISFLPNLRQVPTIRHLKCISWWWYKPRLVVPRFLLGLSSRNHAVVFIFVSKFDPTDGQFEPVVLYVQSLLSWFKDILVHPFVRNHAVLALVIGGLLRLARLIISVAVPRFLAHRISKLWTYSGPLSPRMVSDFRAIR